MERREGPREWSPRKPPKPPILPKFVDAYLEAALWTSTSEDDTPLDTIFSIQDFSELAIAQAVEESNSFIKKNRKDLDASGGSDGQHGHDFWLTRNGHGTGFWDRGYEKGVGKRLTDRAHAFGEIYVYARNGKLDF